MVDSGEPEFPECNNPGGGHVPGESTCDRCGMPGGLIDGRGCSSGCGGGLVDGRGGNQLITSLRAFPWSAWYWSSFGPGMFIDYDSGAYIVDQDGGGISIRLYDAEIGKAITLREPDENGVFGDTLSAYRSTELKDSSDDVTTDLAQAVNKVVAGRFVEHWRWFRVPQTFLDRNLTTSARFEELRVGRY